MTELSRAWDENAEAFIRWARAPGHDSYWQFHRDQFLPLLPPPPQPRSSVRCGEGRLTRHLAGLGNDERSTIHRTDAVRLMASEAAHGAAYDLILLDPPYRMLAALQPAFSLHLPALLVPDGLAVVEGPAASQPIELGLAVDTSRRYGDERLTIYRNG